MVRFIDEVEIEVEGGKGGNGCMSFRRERCVPHGGPNGGDGGRGGNVVLVAQSRVSTLIEMTYHKHFRGSSGQGGGGRDRHGRGGEDCFVKVPVGTKVYDVDHDVLLADLTQPEQSIVVAQGGAPGLGNVHFKSSRNRVPTQTTQGEVGEKRRLRLELCSLADVGLLGFPNAGKSSLIRSVSSAEPKVADYPFTTLKPHLGVVRVDPAFSFVMADIPGIIEGAAEGVGLGCQFLRHVSRCQLLLQVVSLNEEEGDPVETAKALAEELGQFDQDLLQRPRWLVLNKCDLVSDPEAETKRITEALGWQGPVFTISALARQGLTPLLRAIQKYMMEQQG